MDQYAEQVSATNDLKTWVGLKCENSVEFYEVTQDLQRNSSKKKRPLGTKVRYGKFALLLEDYP